MTVTDLKKSKSNPFESTKTSKFNTKGTIATLTKQKSEPIMPIKKKRKSFVVEEDEVSEEDDGEKEEDRMDEDQGQQLALEEDREEEVVAVKPVKSLKEKVASTEHATAIKKQAEQKLVQINKPQKEQQKLNAMPETIQQKTALDNMFDTDEEEQVNESKNSIDDDTLVIPESQPEDIQPGETRRVRKKRKVTKSVTSMQGKYLSKINASLFNVDFIRNGRCCYL